MESRLKALAAGLLLLLLALPARGAEWDRLLGSGPVALEADRLIHDPETGIYRADGNVLLSRGGLTLRADRLQWDPERQEAVAEGGVRLQQGADLLRAGSLRLDLGSGRGSLEQADLFLAEGNLHLTGQRVEKLGAESYRVERGTFTTCDGERPAWQFRARTVEVETGSSAKARHAVFSLFDVPLFYLPYLYYPVGSDRQSGFLLPSFGYSDRRGAELSLSYFLVVARNMDATFTLDYLSDLGVGTGLEYRYIFKETRQGELGLYHLAGFRGHQDRYAVDWRHFGLLPGKIRLAADVEYVSRKDFYADFGGEAEEYTRSSTQSVLYLARGWDRVHLGGQFKYLQDLEQSTDRTPQRLPELRASLLRRRLAQSPFYLLGDLQATYFWRQEGATAEQLDLRPALAGTWHFWNWLDTDVEAGYRQLLVHTSDEQTDAGFVDLSAGLSTRLVRTFRVGGFGLERLLHSVEPEIRYRYAADGGQEDLPGFGHAEPLGPWSRASLVLTNRLLGRFRNREGVPSVRELGYLRLAQHYDFRDPPQLRLAPADRPSPFSDLRFELVIRPTGVSFIDLDGHLDVSSGEDGSDRFRTLNVRGGFLDGLGNGLAAEYRFQKDGPSYLGAEAELALLRPVYVGVEERIDLDGGNHLETTLDLEYRAQCWSLYFTFRDRQDEEEYLVSFALTGLDRSPRPGGPAVDSREESRGEDHLPL